MTDVERLRRADEIVQTALDGRGGELSVLLDAECAGDALLRAEVESLLGYRERAKDLIEAPAFALGAGLFADRSGRDSASAAGRRIGPYQVVREIGRGGMGAVYLAERADGEFRQQVAVKVIRQTLAGSETRRHFKRERQILASLNHPNIARLLDGGVSADGEPFLAMEYVEGVRIDEYADAHALPTSARLNLFRQVCAAVQYAHQNLIIHRDLKPSNILVTAEGVPKLLDFGIAKLLDAEQVTSHTLTELGVMTPEYASPEQVRGESVTTPSDVYSLGVVLYELLAGHRPYRIKSRKPDEIARAICEQEPERPSAAISRTEDPPKADNGSTRTITPETISRARGEQTERLRRRLAGDLDNIVLMAMRKEPSRRYSSVGQFSEDIRRHLEGLPVMARKDTFRYRAGKFVRRNKVGVAAAAVVLLSLVGGIVATLWQASHATQQARVAAQERDRAERRFNDVRQLSNALLTDIVPKIERLQGSIEARQSLVFQSLKYLNSLAQEAEGDLLLQSELAAAYEKIGDLQGNPANPNFIDTEAALKSYEKARAIRLKLLEKTPSDFEQRRNLAENHRVSGLIYGQANDFQTELKNLETALRIYEQLLVEYPALNELKFALAKINHDVAKNHVNNRNASNSFPYLEKAIAVLENLRRENPNQTDVIKLLGDCRTQLSNALSWEGKQTEGEAEAARAIALLEPAVADNPNDVNLRAGLWYAYWLTSSTYEEQNDRLSHEYALKALKIIEETVEQDPANIGAKQQLSKSFSMLGQTSTNTGKPQEALLYLAKAYEVLRGITESRTKNNGLKTDLTAILMRLGAAKFKQEKLQDALADFQQAANIHLEILQILPGDTRTERNLALTYESIAKTHEKIAEKESGEKSLAARGLAKSYYQKTLDVLLQHETGNMLNEYDRDFLERTKKTMQKFDKNR